MARPSRTSRRLYTIESGILVPSAAGASTSSTTMSSVPGKVAATLRALNAIDFFAASSWKRWVGRSHEVMTTCPSSEVAS